MLLQRLQQRLASTYDLDIGDDVREFVVTDPARLPVGAGCGPSNCVPS